MDYSSALMLGVLQGLAEFLPISSSGHLAILGHLLGVKEAGDGALFEILLHVGSAAAIIIVFWERVFGILRVMPWFLMPWQWRAVAHQPQFRMATLVLLASVPAGIVGVLWGEAVEKLFAEIRAIGVLLMVTGAFLLLTRWTKPRERQLSAGRALLVGCVQAVAVLPGISRSGSTISGGLAVGIARPLAGEFSFLLGLVAIIGANLLELPKLASAFAEGGSLQIGPVIAGCIASFIVSWVSLVWLLRFIARGQLWVFGPYCLVVGLATVLWI